MHTLVLSKVDPYVVYGHRESPVWGLWVPVLSGQSLKCYLTARQYETFTTFLAIADMRVPAHQQVPENAPICGQGILSGRDARQEKPGLKTREFYLDP